MTSHRPLLVHQKLLLLILVLLALAASRLFGATPIVNSTAPIPTSVMASTTATA